MNNPYVRAAAEADIAYLLAAGLREADRLELDASGISEEEGLAGSFAATPDCKTVVFDGRPVAMFGAAPVEGSRVGIVWFLGTAEMTNISTRFLRESKRWLEKISTDYDLLTNVVHQSNKLHIRWLRWLGFVFLSRRHGPFVEFARISNV